MKNFFKNKSKDQRGAVVIVEAALVFPIVFFVVILMLYMGNMLYQQSKIDAIAVTGAQYLANLYTAPVLQEDAIPTQSKDINVKPYRYLLGDSDAEDKARRYMENLLDKTGTGFFSGMEMDARVKTCKIKNYVLYQTANVEIEYTTSVLPMRLFDASDLFKVKCASATAATDSAEFIRNIDMVLDYSEELGWTDKINEFVSKFK